MINNIFVFLFWLVVTFNGSSNGVFFFYYLFIFYSFKQSMFFLFLFNILLITVLNCFGNLSDKQTVVIIK